MTDIDERTDKAAPAPRMASVPAVGAPRPGNFWQRWKEWERANGTVPAPIRDRAA